MPEVRDLLVKTENPEYLDQTLQHFGAAVVGGGMPGGFVRVVVGVENTLDYDLEDVKLQVSVDELTLRGTDKIGDLDSDETETARVMLDIPYGTPAGLYDMRIVVSNDDIRRVKYRHLLVI